MLIFSNSFETYISLRKSSSLWTVIWLFSFNWIQSIVVSITANKHVFITAGYLFWATLPINNSTNYQNRIYLPSEVSRALHTKRSTERWKEEKKKKKEQKWTKIIRQQQVIQSITNILLTGCTVLWCVMENFEPFVVTVCARLLFFPFKYLRKVLYNR